MQDAIEYFRGIGRYRTKLQYNRKFIAAVQRTLGRPLGQYKVHPQV